MRVTFVRTRVNPYGFNKLYGDDGFMYCLGTMPEDDRTVENKMHAKVLKYKEDTWELVAMRDFSDYFYLSVVIFDSAVNDVHWNR